MRFHPHLLLDPDQAELDLGSDLHPLPTLWALPDLLPCHRLTCFLAPSGTGLSTLALRLLAHLAPAPEFLPAEPSPEAAWQAAAAATLPAPAPRPITGITAPRLVPSPVGEGQGGGRLPTGFVPAELSYSSYLLLRRRPGPLPLARLQAMQLLTTLLANGPLPVGDKKSPPPNSIRAQLTAAGLAWGTLRRAASEMNLRIFRDAECWYWQLPASPAPATLSPAT